LWVAESPDTIDQETGEVLGENPHIYLMMKWQVPFKHFAAWAQHHGWSQRPQESLWLKQWRQNQLFRRNGTRLSASAEDFVAWYQQADSGEFDLEGDSRGWEPSDEPFNNGISSPIPETKTQSSLHELS